MVGLKTTKKKEKNKLKQIKALQKDWCPDPLGSNV